MTRHPVIAAITKSNLLAHIKKSLKTGFTLFNCKPLHKEFLSSCRQNPPELVVMEASLYKTKTGKAIAATARKNFGIPAIYINTDFTVFMEAEENPRTKIYSESLHSLAQDIIRAHYIDSDIMESKRWLAATLTNIGDALIAVDQKGTVKFMNPAAEGILRQKKDLCVGRNLNEIFKLVSEKTLSPVPNPVFKAMSTMKMVRAPMDIMLQGIGNENIYVGCKATPIARTKGGLDGAVLVFWDVTLNKQAQEALAKAHNELENRVKERTAELANANKSLQAEIGERKKAEKELAEAYAELQQAHLRLIQSEKLAALGRFSSGIAHEIKNPLGIILGGVEFLQMHSLVSADFTEKEFQDPRAARQLLTLFSHDFPDYVSKLEEGDPLRTLNAILCVPDFFDKWLEKNKGKDIPRVILETNGLSQNIRSINFDELLPSDQMVIKFLNRLLLETSYSDLCPKSADFNVFSTICKIKSATLRADTIVKNLLRFARPSELKTEKVNPREIIEYSLSHIPSGELNHVSVNTVCEDDMEIAVDRNQITQVIINIITNAAQAIPKKRGGQIRIRAYKVTSGENEQRSMCAIEVKDNGEGIKKEDMPRIFEPFFTTKIYHKSAAGKKGETSPKGEVQGTGLGLSVSKSIINKHRGEMVLSSVEGEGTTIKITLPLAVNPQQ